MRQAELGIEGEVFTDGEFFDQHILLRDVANETCHALWCIVDVHIHQLHRAERRTQAAVQDAPQGGFAGPTAAHDAHQLTCAGFKAELVEGLRLGTLEPMAEVVYFKGPGRLLPLLGVQQGHQFTVEQRGPEAVSHASSRRQHHHGVRRHWLVVDAQFLVDACAEQKQVLLIHVQTGHHAPKPSVKCFLRQDECA